MNNQLIIDFEVLAKVAKATRELKAGEIVFKAGDEGHEFFVVRQGSVAIKIGNRQVDTIGPSQVFGEMAIVDGAPRSATAMAETDSVIVPLTEKQFLILIAEAPYFALEVMRVLARRLRTANASVA